MYICILYIYIYTHVSLFVNGLQLDVYMHTCICYEWQHLFCAFRATPCFHSPLSKKSYEGSVHKLEECISASDSATQPVDCASLADLGQQVRIRCIYAHMYLLHSRFTISPGIAGHRGHRCVSLTASLGIFRSLCIAAHRWESQLSFIITPEMLQM